MTQTIKTLLFIPATSFALLAACRREKNEDTASPAYHIRQSEAASIPAQVDLPVNLPNGYTRVATLYADGVQKYKAQPKSGSIPVTYEWVFVAPQADLFDATNKRTGTHGAGPFWSLSTADSLFAQAFNPPKFAPSPEAAIDWLLLMPKTGKASTGVFARVDFIQRIATRGGKAPAAAPTASTDVAEVPYTAVYRFSKKNP